MRTRNNTTQAMTTKPRTSQQWRASVDKIPELKIRRHAACVIYWDHIAKMIDEDVSAGMARDKACERHGHLTPYVDAAFSKTHPINPEDESTKLCEALIIAGYTKTDARNRSQNKGYQSKKVLDPARPTN